MIESIFRSSVGIDVHQSVIVLTFLQEEGSEVAREHAEFPTFTKDLQEMADWVSKRNPGVVVMESTSVYWFPVYQALEDKGICSLVVNARHIKTVPGRKTDTQDSEWLAEIAKYGLVRGSFVPPRDIRQLRQLTRYRRTLVQMVSAEKNRLHKVLESCGIKLGIVVSSIDGVSAWSMVKALAQGSNSPTELANLAKGRLRAKIDPLREALTAELSDRHRSVLQTILSHIEWIEESIKSLDVQIVAALGPYRESFELLQTIPGIDETSAAVLLAECGASLEPFPTVKHFCSWAGVCPGNNESAGKRKSGRTRKANKYVRSTICECAHAASRTKSQFKGYYQSVSCRRGNKKAIFAVAHKLLRIIYKVLQSRQPYYDPVVDYEKAMVERNASRWITALKKFGYAVDKRESN